MNIKTKRIIIYSLLILTILFLLLYKYYKNEDVAAEISKTNNSVQKKELIVNGIVLKYSSFSNSVFSRGSLLADEEVELKPEIAGKVISINFREGTRVKKGDLLIKLNDNELKPQLAKAESRLKLLELTENRQKQLYEKQGISKQDYDIAITELVTQRAEISYLKALIEKTEIRAPFDGVIGLRNISEGAYITPNNVITILQKNDYLKLDFSIPQKYYNDLKQTNILRFRVLPDTNLNNVNLIGIEPKIDEQTRTIRLRGRFSNTNNKFIAGSYAEVFLDTKDNRESIMIPSFSLIPDLESEFVYVFSNGIATKRNVRIGFRDDLRVEVISGLLPNDTLISSGIMQLRPGTKVKINIIDEKGAN